MHLINCIINCNIIYELIQKKLINHIINCNIINELVYKNSINAIFKYEISYFAVYFYWNFSIR